MNPGWTRRRAAIIAAMCLGLGVMLLVLLIRVRGGALPHLREILAQYQARTLACASELPHQLVPGSYQADPPRAVGDYVVVTFTAQCDSPGRPRAVMTGYAAVDRGGRYCFGQGERHSGASTPGNPVTVEIEMGAGTCGGSGRPGLTVMMGYVTGEGATSAEMLFTSGTSAFSPIVGGRFTITAPIAETICTVRALDAQGTVLARSAIHWSGNPVPQAPCT